MNNYRRFKYPFGGETPQEFADARRAYYENVSNDAYQQIASGSTPTNLKHVEATSPEVRDYIERTGREVTDYINRNYNNQPSARKGKIIRNHDKLYDYYKDGDKLYYRKKGGKNWIDISDNDVAQKRINATIARNKKSYSKPKNSSQTVEDNKTYDAGTLNDVVVTSTRRKAPVSTSISAPRRIQGANSYKNNSTKKSNSYQPISTQGISGVGPYRSTVPLTEKERKATPGAIASTVFRKVKNWLTNSNNRYNQRNGITGNNTSSIVSTRGVGAYR